jgi:hypothetical protein
LIAGFAALMVVAFTVPAMADMKIGGIVFTDFYYMKTDGETLQGGVAPNGQVVEDDRGNTQIDVPNISRLYGRWTNEDNVGLYIEYGLGDGTTAGGDGSSSIRFLYGWWDVTPGFRLLVGHSTTPFSPLNPNQLMGTRNGFLNIIGVGYGDFYSGRFQQVRGSFNLPSDMGRIELTLVDPNANMSAVGVNYANVLPVDLLGASVDEDSVIPRVDLTAALYFGALKLYPGILWHRHSYDNVAPGFDDDVTTWIATIGGSWGTGPFSIEAEFNYGENWGQTRGLIGASPSAALSNALLTTAGSFEDTTSYSWWIDLGFKVMPNATLHGVIGNMNSENDGDPAVVGSDWDFGTWMYGLSFPIDLAKGFRIRPEFFFYDDGDEDFGAVGDVDFGSHWMLGAQFQVTF